MVIAFGLGLTFSGQTGYTDAMPVWLIISFVWVAAAAVLSATVQTPTTKRAIALLEGMPDGHAFPRELGPIARRLKITGQLLSLSTVGVMFLMVWKPGA